MKTTSLILRVVVASLLQVALWSGCSSDSKTSTDAGPDARRLDGAAIDAAVDGPSSEAGDGRAVDATAGEAGDGPVCPASPAADHTVPAAIQAPAGTTLLMHLYAVGTQIYTCMAVPGDADAGTSLTYKWSFKAPDATLYDAQCAAVGTHFAGPTWKWTADGSSVKGTVKASITPDASAIPWLLLTAVAHDGQGVMTPVTYVQRLDTSGGTAPTTGCDAAAVGHEQAVPYSANYYYYSGAPADGGADAPTPDAAADAGADAAPADAAGDSGSDDGG
jgi:hypothetical protein